MKGSKTLIFFTIVSLLCSCGQSKDSVVEVHSGSRDKVTAVTLTSIDDALPMIHSDARFSLCGDTLIIRDRKSTDKALIAYDLNNDRYLGSFGKVGQGPGEITGNFGGLFYDPERGILYGLDLGKWQIAGFNLREAVVDSTYNAFTKVKLSNLGGPFTTPYYVNDTTVLCSVYVPDETGMKLTSHVGKFNLLTGERVPLASVAEEGNSGLTTVSLAKKMIIETETKHDRIRFYDLDGNLKRTVYGPDYTEKHDRRAYYFSEPVMADDKILAVYSGIDYRKNGTGHVIIVMDLDGNYIRTLDVGARISSITYHDKTDRVYISSDDEPQFGYFNLSEALGEPASARKVSAPVEDKAHADKAETETVEDSEPAKDSESGEGIVLPNGVRVIYSSPMAANAPAYSKSRNNKGPLALADPLSHSFNPVDITYIGAEPNDDNGVKYTVSLVDPKSEDVTVESIILPDARFEVDWTGTKKYKPGLLSTFTLKAKKAVEQNDFRFILTYKGDKYAPQTFHINLHPDINKLISERANDAGQ